MISQENVNVLADFTDAIPVNIDGLARRLRVNPQVSDNLKNNHAGILRQTALEEVDGIFVASLNVNLSYREARVVLAILLSKAIINRFQNKYIYSYSVSMDALNDTTSINNVMLEFTVDVLCPRHDYAKLTDRQKMSVEFLKHRYVITEQLAQYIVDKNPNVN